MKTNITLFFAILIIFTSCKAKKDTSTGDQIPLLIKQTEIPGELASTEISKMSIEGNILSIDVSYSGGCEEHDFKLYFNGNYKKSLPPKANFVLHHDNKGDACREFITKTLRFDISPCQYEGQKEIIVSINNSENTVSYKY